jgi:hypothetical protein
VPSRIYFDNAATTALDPRVLEAMRPYLDEFWGNPSSLYAEGRQAREAVDRARTQVARLLGAESGEIVFTGSGTEADNLAVQGVLLATGLPGSHLVTSAIEHPAILACCRQLERLGVAVTELPVSGGGLVDPADLESATRPPSAPSTARSWGCASSLATAAGCAPLITDCTIRNNAKKEGGGILVWHGSPLIRRCEILYNNSESAGGGIRTAGGSPKVEECHIAFNSADRGNGGGISSDFSAPVILRNIIAHNMATEGGGIATGVPSLGEGFLSGNAHSKPTISGNTVTHNFARLVGGGIAVEGSPTLTKNLIVNNGPAYGLLNIGNSETDKPEIRKNHTGAGAFIRGTYGGTAIVEQNRIVHNLGARWGGGIMMVNASGRLRQNVIVDNAARYSGGGASLVLTTFWGTGANRDHGPSYDVVQSLVAGNAGGGIEFAGGGQQSASVQDSNISENRPFDFENRTNQQIKAQNVWLGSNDLAELNRRIYDYFDNQTCGKLVCASADRALDLADLPDLPDALRQFYATAPQDFRAGVALAPDEAKELAVGLAWTAPSVKGVAGYRIYFDAHTLYTTSPFGNRGVCDQGRSPVDVGENKKAKLSGFRRGTTYSFAISAYDSEDHETAYSNIIPITIPRQ